MAPFKRVLAPTDFGHLSDRALEAGIEVAKKFEADLTLVHAYALPAVAYGGGLARPTEELQRAARAALDGALSRAKARYPRVEAVLVDGDPRRQILDVAEVRGVDLIVLGTHGRKGLARALLGSVAERVIRSSPVPVLAVSARGEHEEAGAD